MVQVDARQELDLKIGIAFSRLMTRAYLSSARAKFRLRDQRVLSYGPCQTPALWFCAQRHKEIVDFVPKPFWTPSVRVALPGVGPVTLPHAAGDVHDEGLAARMRRALAAAEHATVVGVREEQRTVRRLPGLNTVQLLKACSSGLGLSPAAAMKACPPRPLPPPPPHARAHALTPKRVLTHGSPEGPRDRDRVRGVRPQRWTVRPPPR